MARLPILIAPDPRLRRRAEPFDRADPEIARLAGDMLETMYDADGLGLAAPQVGVLRRLLVVDAATGDGRGKAPTVMVNPEVVALDGGPVRAQEGCLSFPGQFTEVERPGTATVRYRDAEGGEHVRDFAGLEATCVQHEIDHLDGVLFVDRIGSFRRDRILKGLAKWKRERARAAAAAGEPARAGA